MTDQGLRPGNNPLSLWIESGISPGRLGRDSTSAVHQTRLAWQVLTGESRLMHDSFSDATDAQRPATRLARRVQ